MSSPASTRQHDGTISGRIRVWDPLVRVLHWSLVTGVAVAWLTEDGPGKLHEGAGYVALGVVAIRGLWGFIGPAFTRFRSFVRPKAETLDYAKAVLHGNEPRHLGHNPLGGWMIVALLLTVAATGGTGWLYTTDMFWGIKWMEGVHETFANLLLVLIALHVGGVIFTSIRQRENLVAAMIHGHKERRPGDAI